MMVVPQRTCIGCGQVKAKRDLIRIVRSSVGGQESQKARRPESRKAGFSSLESIVTVDLRGKEKGRGAYVCPNIDCINRAMRPGRLNKAFRIIPNSSDRISLETIDRLKQNLFSILDA
jgi:predicted RNA-binding protein YlxR (DUF448 family)